METVSGILETREAAEQLVLQIQSLGVANDRIALLMPDMSKSQVDHDVPVSDTESPGEGKALGGAVGGAIGAAGGVSLGAAAVSLLVPGVGPILAGGILGAAILGIGGAATGMAVGEALDKGLVEGLPHDELDLYKQALKRGKSVVVAFVEDEQTAESVRAAFESAGAESKD